MKLNLQHSKNHINRSILGTLLLASFSSVAQINITPNQNNCLETQYSFSRQGKVEQLFVNTFDNKGLIQKQTKTFTSNFTGNYSEEFVYEYDAQGNNTKITYSHNNAVKKVTQRAYNANGTLLQETVSANGTTPIKKSLFANGSTEDIFFNSDGQTESVKEKTTFDLTGKIITKEVFSAAGKLAFSDKYTYTSSGYVNRFVHFDAVDKVTVTTNYEYDAKDNLTKETTLRNDVLFAETLNTYNAQGQLEKKTRLNGNNKVDYFFTYEYNNKGLLAKENYFYNNQIQSVRYFDYDPKGNTTKETYEDTKGLVKTVKQWEYLCK